MQAVLAQVDPMRPDIEDEGKGWVLISELSPLLIWGDGQTAGTVKPRRLEVVRLRDV
jgi:hypothetical protein